MKLVETQATNEGGPNANFKRLKPDLSMHEDSTQRYATRSAEPRYPQLLIVKYQLKISPFSQCCAYTCGLPGGLFCNRNEINLTMIRSNLNLLREHIIWQINNLARIYSQYRYFYTSLNTITPYGLLALHTKR